MKKAWERLRKWLIVKLGGHVKEPVPVIRFERTIAAPIEVQAECRYAIGAPTSAIRRIVADELAKRLCANSLVEYQFEEYPEPMLDVRRVRGIVKVIPPECRAKEWD